MGGVDLRQCGVARLVGEGEVLVRWVSTVLEVVVEGAFASTAARPAAHNGYDGLHRQEFGFRKRRING